MSTSTLQFSQNTPECPVLDPVLENFPLAGRRSCAPPTPFLQRSQLGPMTSALPKTRIHHCSGLKLHHVTHYNGYTQCSSGNFLSPEVKKLLITESFCYLYTFMKTSLNK